MPKPESKRLIPLATAAEVIDALGHARVSELTGKSYKQVWAWRAAGIFPARYFLLMVWELSAKGYSAPTALWRQTLPRNKEALLWILARKLQAA
ncbi:hypothetical protein [Bradyrhizobium sp. 188]|uniref:hypothetical protein n=1 Tax=Bradyrhizobium sp. 188 TaxID=2782656 RepID=UPI001FFB881B|nr:hypothetical protein [Bradyrhizobium sp. 188]MCK1501470.1 hypothetical protein [Bradyrhizobium sp. 188]